MKTGKNKNARNNYLNRINQENIQQKIEVQSPKGVLYNKDNNEKTIQDKKNQGRDIRNINKVGEIHNQINQGHDGEDPLNENQQSIGNNKVDYNNHEKMKNREGTTNESSQANNEQTTEDKVKQFQFNYKSIAHKLLKSEIGLYNAGGSCYMASIIQILIHLKKFLNIFLQKRYKKNSPLSHLFYDFIEKIANTKSNAIEIKYFAKEYNKINNKFSGKHGNNPMTFFNEFIQKLNEENGRNNDILNLFMGQKYINFKENEDLNYYEDFIFYLIALDKNKTSLYNTIINYDTSEGDESMVFNEKIIIKPEILIINLEIEDICYEFEEIIFLDDDKYILKAINRYTDFHSTA
jgi:hypothetical protein